MGALSTVRDELRLVLGMGVDLGSLPAVLAAAYGDRPAIDAPAWPPGLSTWPVRSYRGLEEDVARLAAAHHALGNANGVRVILAVANRIDVLLHVFALARAGAVPVPVNPRLKPAELREVVRASRATVILVDTETAASLAPDGSAPGGARFCWSGFGATPPASVTEGGDVAGFLTANPEARLAPSGRLAPDGIALLLCTSGTTGHPKVATLTSAGLLGGPGRLLAAPVGHDRGLRAGRDVVLAALPLPHVMGIGTFLGALCAGTKVLHHERFDAHAILRRIEHDRPNVFVGVPTMYADLEGEGAAHYDLGSIQVWVSAADVMPPERARRFQQYGAAGSILGTAVGSALFADVYGMVELSGAAAVRIYPPAPRGVELPAVAFTLPGFEARVVDEDGKVLRWGKTGSLHLRGPSVLQKYEGAEGAGPLPGGWFPTGDLAKLWPGGFFTFMGRSRDRLKVGGFSVFPAEVETTLREHPDVAEVVMVGVPDPRLGERPVVLVIPKRTPFDASAFVAWAADRVAGYRRPREAIVVTMLPRGHHGKINRAEATRLAMSKLAGG